MTARPPPEPADVARQRESLQRLARLLDSAIRLPGGFRIGLDGLLGLLPGVGDLAGALLSAYIVAQAYRLGAPRSMLMKMVANVALETGVGVIPVAGDLFDFAWKANRRNLELLERYLDDRQANGRQAEYRRATGYDTGRRQGGVTPG